MVATWSHICCCLQIDKIPLERGAAGRSPSLSLEERAHKFHASFAQPWTLGTGLSPRGDQYCPANPLFPNTFLSCLKEDTRQCLFPQISHDCVTYNMKHAKLKLVVLPQGEDDQQNWKLYDADFVKCLSVSLVVRNYKCYTVKKDKMSVKN